MRLRRLNVRHLYRRPLGGLLAVVLACSAACSREVSGPNYSAAQVAAAMLALGKLTAAMEKEISYGDCKTTMVSQPNERVTKLDTQYSKLLPDHTKLIRKEMLYRDLKGREMRSTILSRADGEWILYPGVAIRFVDKSISAREEMLASVQHPEWGSPLYSESDRVIDDRHYTVVAADFPPLARAASARQLHKVYRDKVTLEQAREMIPARREYHISAELGIVTTVRDLAENGRILTENRIDGFSRETDLPVSLFEIPADAVRLLPSTAEEFAELNQLYRSRFPFQGPTGTGDVVPQPTDRKPQIQP